MKQIFIAAFLFILTANAFAQTLELSVSGNVDFDNSSFSVSEAGEDFPSSVVSESSAEIDLEYSSWGDNWFGGTYVNWHTEIYHEPADSESWNDALTLETKRTGNGERDSWWGSSSLTGGGTFQEITETSTTFFSGNYGTLNIPINFRLSGASLTMGAGDFETTIVITYYED